MIAQGVTVVPGQLLASASQGLCEGEGCYSTEQGEIRATLYGVVKHEAVVVGKGSNEEHMHRVHVLRVRKEGEIAAPASSGSQVAYETVEVRDMSAKIGDRVLCRVLKIMLNQISCEILAIDDVELRTKSRAVIRREDMRLENTDQLVVHECFRPGDIVRAEVLSLGDLKQYYLTTAEVDLGVRFALSETNHNSVPSVLQPVTWNEMIDVVSGAKEKRKVAKP